MDDCNLKFVDTCAMKRFLAKCGIVATDFRVLAIIRRWDLNADAKLSKGEFFEGVTP